MHARWAALALVATVGSTAHAGAAQDAEALAAKGKFVQAAAKFREAYAADRRPELMCNVGVAYFKAKDLPRAHRYLRHCLALGKDLDRGFMDSVAKVLSSVDAQLTAGEFTPVEVIVQPSTARVAVDGDVPFDEPLADGDRVWFPSGDYRLSISATGYTTLTTQLRAQGKSAEVQRYVLERAAATKVPQDPAPVRPAPSVLTRPDATPDRGTVIPPSTDTGPRPPSIIPPVAASGATAVFGLATLVFWLRALEFAEKAGETMDPIEYADLTEDVKWEQQKMWVTGTLAVLGAGASGFLWWRWNKQKKAYALDVSTSSTGATIGLSGRW